MTKVSIIVPIFNVEKYLARCLDTLVNQTLKDIEIICINDCSTDKSLAILSEFVKKDKRIKVIDSKQKSGVASARNIGLEIASGEYIGFVDPDDKVDLNFYEELYKKAVEKDADIVKCKMRIISTDGSLQEDSNLNDSIRNKSKIYFTNEWTTAIYKSSLIFQNNIKFSEDLIICEDVAFLNKAVIKAKSIECIDNVRYYYIRRNNSLNSNKMNLSKIRSFLTAIEYIIDDCDNALDKDLSEDEYALAYFIQLKIIIYYLLYKNETFKAHQMCIETYLNIFHKCKKPNKLEKLFASLHYMILFYTKRKNAEELIDMLTNYETIEEYRIAQLRKNVKKDLLCQKFQ